MLDRFSVDTFSIPRQAFAGQLITDYCPFDKAMLNCLTGSHTTMAPTLPPRVRFADFEVDLRSGRLQNQGVKIRLQEQPFRVLAALLEASGEVVTREELRSRL